VLVHYETVSAFRRAVAIYCTVLSIDSGAISVHRVDIELISARVPGKIRQPPQSQQQKAAVCLGHQCK
jgi:hypothetical protein